MVLVEPLAAEQIERMPVYDWAVAMIGDEAPPLTYDVSQQSIADYCEAVRNFNPVYRDGLAPPTFIYKCAPHRRNEVMHARGYASPEEKADRATPFAKSELFFYKPIRVGDKITSTVRLEDMYERRGSQFMIWRTRATDAAGELVAEYTYTIIWRQGPAAESRGSSVSEPAASGEPLPSVTRLESQEAIDRYAELTRVRPRVGQSLHTDDAFARRTIFGGTVNMGVATAAYCSEALEQAFGPESLLRPGARLEFKGIRPVRAGDEITVTGQVVVHTGERAQCALTVHNQTMTLVGIAGATLIP